MAAVGLDERVVDGKGDLLTRLSVRRDRFTGWGIQ
jgi:hypothetical protein